MRATLRVLLLVAIICLAGCSREANVFTAAVTKGDKQAIETQLQANPKILERQNSEGKTPLIVAVESGNMEMVQFLLDKNAKVNGQDKNGLSAMHYVAISSQPAAIEIAKLLIGKGGDVNAKNNEGLTPVNYAKKKGISRGAAYILTRYGGTE